MKFLFLLILLYQFSVLNKCRKLSITSSFRTLVSVRHSQIINELLPNVAYINDAIKLPDVMSSYHRFSTKSRLFLSKKQSPGGVL